MMKTEFIIISIFFVITIHGNEPQVREELEDEIKNEFNARIVRDPFVIQRTRNYEPPTFSYENAYQQDMRKYRYLRQQISDLSNIMKRSNEESHRETPLVQKWSVSDAKTSPLNVELKHSFSQETTPLVQKWRVSDTKASPLNVEAKPSFSQETPVTVWRKVPLISSRSNRRLNPSSYFEALQDKSKISRDDSEKQVVYVHPNLIKGQFKESERELEALSSLIGQHPNAQLEGLKLLLQKPYQNYVLPPIKGPQPFQAKDYTPIMEQSIDVPNHQAKTTIISGDNTKATLAAIQAELDAVAKAETEKALAQAHQEALAQVDVQQKAIEEAKARNEKEALAKIAAHNQGLDQAQLLHPLALPLKAEVVPLNSYAPKHQNVLVNPQKHFLTQLRPHNDDFLKKNLNLAEKPKKISYTQTHSVLNGHGSPKVFQEVVLETSHRNHNFVPDLEAQQSISDKTEENQYAARYAFGYKIKDVKMGNDFGHEEKRDGKSAKGHYHVLLPDGRMQKVDYYADPTGYHAKVTYENVGHH